MEQSLENYKKMVEKLQKEVTELELENSNLKKVVRDNDLEDEVSDIDCMSAEERICVSGIKNLEPYFAAGTMTKDDATVFDTLHKNLRLIRGQDGSEKSKSKKKAMPKAKLLKIAQKANKDA